MLVMLSDQFQLLVHLNMHNQPKNREDDDKDCVRSLIIVIHPVNFSVSRSTLTFHS